MGLMDNYEEDVYRASDRLRECRRRMDALGRRWRAGDASVSAALDEAFREFRTLQSAFFRAKAIAAQAAKVQQRKGTR